MAIIKWSASLSVQVEEIDEQHKKLIGLLGELDAAMAAGKGKAALATILTDLMSYSVYHFALEEKYMDLFRYPDAAVHKAEHQGFIAEVTAFKAGFDAGRLGLSLKVLAFLSQWLRTHIMGSDQRYSANFCANGLK